MEISTLLKQSTYRKGNIFFRGMLTTPTMLIIILWHFIQGFFSSLSLSPFRRKIQNKAIWLLSSYIGNLCLLISLKKPKCSPLFLTFSPNSHIWANFHMKYLPMQTHPSYQIKWTIDIQKKIQTKAIWLLGSYTGYLCLLISQKKHKV